MNTNPMISVIVPVYNVEQYLPQCIDSILAQTYRDFELLLIDDGSPDRSGRICDEYAARDERVRVFHKENGGVSSARNLGLDNAQGEWITFVDADDVLIKETFDILYERGEFYKYDFIRFGAYRFSDNTDKTEYISRKSYSFDLPKYRYMVITRTTYINVWSCLFRKSIFDKYKIRFRIGMRFGEDWLALAMFSCRAQSYYYVAESCYGYRVNPSSVIQKNLDHLYTDSVKAIPLVIDYARESGIDIDNRTIRVLKFQFCKFAMGFASREKTKEAFLEAKLFIREYCYLSILKQFTAVSNLGEFKFLLKYIIKSVLVKYDLLKYINRAK